MSERYEHKGIKGMRDRIKGENEKWGFGSGEQELMRTGKTRLKENGIYQ